MSPIYESQVFKIGQDRIRASMYRTAEDVLSKGLTASAAEGFDVFLSHSIKDASVVLGVVDLLESEGITVYVDWLVDPHLNRSDVSRQTANQLRERMRSCRSLIFATSASSPASKWMPWELGYFDGFKGERVAILPLVDDSGSARGQEYLDLYPQVEVVSVGSTRRLGATRGTFHREGLTLADWLRGKRFQPM